MILKSFYVVNYALKGATFALLRGGRDKIVAQDYINGLSGFKQIIVIILVIYYILFRFTRRFR